MWHELTELLLGLAGAVAVLCALYLFIVKAQQTSVEEDGEPQHLPQEPPHYEPSHHEPSHHEPSQHGPSQHGPSQHGPSQHEALTRDDGEAAAASAQQLGPHARPVVAALYICAEAGMAMQRVPVVEAIAGAGLEGDRYSCNQGHWSESDECEVTLIAEEDLGQAQHETGISLRDGRHRRNIVTRDLDPLVLLGQRFRIGGAYFSAARPRPPCLYLQQITEPGLARALVGRGGIGVHCFQGGPIREGDSIEVLDLSLASLLRRRWRSRRTGKGTSGPQA